MSARLLFSLLAPVLIIACQRQEAAPPLPPIVLTQTVGESAGGQSAYTGEVRARHEVDLAFRVGGKIASRLVDVGAEIRPGQPLARLDPSDLQLAAEAARAQQAAAESDLKIARQERQRYADLLAKKFVSQAAYDARDNAAQAAEARLTQAQTGNRISANQSTYGTLTAEFPAVVISTQADAGQVVAAGQAVLRIARPEEKEIAIAVPESRLAAFKAAQRFVVRPWAAPEQHITGQLRELAPAADTATRTYAARIRLINPPTSLRLGMTAQVSIEDTTATGLTALPLSAVENPGNGARVWLVRDGKAQPQNVTVSQYREQDAVISQGLRAGDTVIVAGLSKLLADMPVRSQPATPAGERR